MPGSRTQAGEARGQRRAGRADLASSVVFEARHDLEAPAFGFHFLNADGEVVFGFNRTLRDSRTPRADGSSPGSACGSPGASRTCSLPGRYFLALLDLAQPYAGRPRAAHRPPARVRRLRHTARARQRDRAGRRRDRARARADDDPTPARSGAGHAAARKGDPVGLTDTPLELRDVRGPSALGGGWRRSLELLYLIAVIEFKRHVLRYGARLPVVARAPADALRRPARGLHAGVPRRLAGAALSRAAAVQHRALRLLPGGDSDRRDVDRRPGGSRAQDAVPAARDPAGRRADVPVQPRPEPRRGARLHAGVRRRADCGRGCCSRSCWRCSS